MEALVQEFPHQPLDFFGAIRARMYDDVVMEMIQREGGSDNIAKILARPRKTRALGAPSKPRDQDEVAHLQSAQSSRAALHFFFWKKEEENDKSWKTFARRAESKLSPPLLLFKNLSSRSGAPQKKERSVEKVQAIRNQRRGPHELAAGRSVRRRQ